MKRITEFFGMLCALFIVLCAANVAQAYTFPIEGNYRISNPFWGCGLRCYHLGTDIIPNPPSGQTTAAGVEVLSICTGSVAEVTYNEIPAGNYGGRVLVECENFNIDEGMMTVIYGHLGEEPNGSQKADVFVRTGDWVDEGTPIGRLGPSDENGGSVPHLHLGTHRGEYLGNATECGKWHYAGYTPVGTTPSDACYCNILDNWLDPQEVLGMKTPDLRIVDGNVNPPASNDPANFTWWMSANGGRRAPITASVLIYNPVRQQEQPFIMRYISGTDRPFEFDYQSAVQDRGTYGYRFQLQTCAEKVIEPNRRYGPQIAGGSTNSSSSTQPPSGGSSSGGSNCIPQEEICDQEDNDCDGRTDEHVTQACSNDCGTGVQVCDLGRWLPCTATQQPREEVCDNQDNDCNGQVDDNVAPRECHNECGHWGEEYCDKGSWIDCNAPTCGNCTPRTEVCDNVDNDCDGSVDENIEQPCTNECGNSGVKRCNAGSWGSCNASACNGGGGGGSGNSSSSSSGGTGGGTGGGGGSSGSPPGNLIAPTISAPANEAIQESTGISATVTLSWQSVSGAGSYEYLVRYGGFNESGALLQQQTVNGTSTGFTMSASSYGLELIWKVRARNSNGAGPWSEKRSFYFSHSIGSIVQCASNSCPSHDAWYKFSRDIDHSDVVGVPGALFADYINLACSSGRSARNINFEEMAGYSRSNRYNGCPP